MYDGGHTICHCLKNESDQSFFVDWEDTGTKGVVLPRSDVYSMESFGEDKFRSEKKKIWFGAGPDKIEGVETLVFDETIASDTSTYRSKASIGAIVNRLSEMNSEEDLKAAASDPSQVDRLDMIFEVKSIPGSELVEYSCVYSIDYNGEAKWDAVYFMGFSSTDLNKVMFGTDSPLLMNRGVPSNFIESNNRSLKIQPLPERQAIIFKVVARVPKLDADLTRAAFQITSSTGLVAASMPVSFWNEAQ